MHYFPILFVVEISEKVVIEKTVLLNYVQKSVVSHIVADLIIKLLCNVQMSPVGGAVLLPGPTYRLFLTDGQLYTHII